MTTAEHLEILSGIVERVTFHNEQNGWSVLRVRSFKDPAKLVTVVLHQSAVFAGATFEFRGEWDHHAKHGEQFKASQALEKKPATAAALEKYLGSGLIAGVGPATARRIVNHFREKTLEVFESDIESLRNVPGIAAKKLQLIKDSWQEHRSIRDVMIFLQGYGISTLFATKIYRAYGDQAIAIVQSNPYRLAQDIQGIGFFSADRIALAMGLNPVGEPRIEAGIKHVLAASGEAGHCYLTAVQISTSVPELLREPLPEEIVQEVLRRLIREDQIKRRHLVIEGQSVVCYYSKRLYFDELSCARHIRRLIERTQPIDTERIQKWIAGFCAHYGIVLSAQQAQAVCGIVGHSLSILTGGPGCGKTTCTRVLVQLLRALNLRVTLAAPTGRAAQRMTEVIGQEAKTIHRLLEWTPEHNGFRRGAELPLETDFLIVDEVSMLDVSLAASLLEAVPAEARVLLVGDPDQLAAVGAGDVLADLLRNAEVPRYRLTQIFRQAQHSAIIRFAHQINAGEIPKIPSPLATPEAFAQGQDCLFVDADEATRDQAVFIHRARQAILEAQRNHAGVLLQCGDQWRGRLLGVGTGAELDPLYQPPVEAAVELRRHVLHVPEKFRHVNLVELAQATTYPEELMAVLGHLHPWSSIHWGLTAVDTVLRLVTKTLPEWLGLNAEIQILCPQVRGTMGTLNLNAAIQKVANPPAEGKHQLEMGAKILRVRDRVIQTRNNYDLGVFNGDIGHIHAIDPETLSCEVSFSGQPERHVIYDRQNLSDLTLAYAITVHKAQGSEFQAVILPVLTQHYSMLYRNLIYTGLTRAKKLAVFVGNRRALSMAIQQVDQRSRQTALNQLISTER